jgi:plasmid stabilization system protein ParE
LTEAFDWYSGEGEWLGKAFLAEMDAAVARIAEAPLQYPVVYRETRRARVRRFPYAVFYRVESDHVLVLAVLHMKRNPVRWHVREPSTMAA